MNSTDWATFIGTSLGCFGIGMALGYILSAFKSLISLLLPEK